MSRLLCLLLAGFLAATAAQAQQFPLPQASPHAVVTQTLGLTDVTVDYHTPGVKNRKVWGGLVPYDQVWRAGANENTLITFTDSVRVSGKPVAAGTYSLYVQPSADHDWQLILNKVTTHWGNEGYDPKDDVLRVPVLPETTPNRETLHYWFSDVRPGAGRLNLSWETKTISVFIRTNVHAKVLLAMQQAVQKTPNDPQLLAQAADYLIQNQIEAETALRYINRAIELNDSYTNNWLKARLMAQKEDYLSAVESARRAIKLGDKDDDAFKTQLPSMKVALTQWQSKAY
jgi:tetratricopeptide (TPR) repeat protein